MATLTEGCGRALSRRWFAPGSCAKARTSFARLQFEPLEGRVVLSAATTTTLISSSNPSTFGTPVTLTAAVAGTGGTPTGSVTFDEGSTVLGTAAVNGSGVATFTTSATALPGGTDQLTAIYGGDSTFATSTSTALTQVVNTQTTTTTLTANPTSSTLNQSVTLTARVTPATSGTGTPTGLATFNDGSTALGSATVDSSGVATLTTSSIAVGSQSLTASYAGDTNFTPSTSTAVTMTVATGASVTTLTTSANPVALGGEATFTATVSPAVYGTTTLYPTGTVTFLSGTTTLGSGTLDSAGVATYSTSTLPVGASSITASYPGDTNYAASTSAALAQTITGSGAVVTVTAAPTLVPSGQSVTLTATVAPTISGAGTPTGTVTFFNGTTDLGSAAVSSSGTAVLSVASLPLGNNAITAQYTGDSNFTATTSAVTVVGSGNTNEIFLNEVYLDLLRRPIDPAGLTFWEGLLNKGESRTKVVLGIVRSREYATTTLADLSQSLTGQAPSAAEEKAALSLQASGQAGPRALETLVLSSPAYYAQVGGTSSAFVSAVARAVTGQALDSAEAAPLDRLASHGTRREVVLKLLRSQAGLTNTVDADYSTYLGRPSDAGGLAFFVGQLRRGVSGAKVLAELLGSGEFATSTLSAGSVPTSF